MRQTMEEAIKSFPKLSGSLYWKKIFKQMSLGKYPSGVRITKTKLYCYDDYVSINECKDNADFYIKVVDMLKKHMKSDNVWANVKSNVKMEMVYRYCKKCADEYKLDKTTLRNLISVCRMIIFSLKNCKSFIVMKKGEIVKINCIKFSMGNFTLKDNIDTVQSYIFNTPTRDIFNKSCNKFEKDLLRKLNSYG